MRRSLLILLWMLGTLWAAQPVSYPPGSKLKVQCNDAQIPFKLDGANTFSVSLVGGNIPKNVDLTLSMGDNKCSMTNSNMVCRFQAKSKILNIKCTNSFEFVFKVVDPQVLQEDTMLKAQYIEIELQPQTSGIVAIKNNDDVNRRIRQLKPNSPILALFSYSDCVQNIALFQDHIRMALQHRGGPCIVGLRDDIRVEWLFVPSTKSLKEKSLVYENYINKEDSIVYTLPEDPVTRLEIIVESDIIDELSRLHLTLIFTSKDGSYTYNLTNFLNGMYPFISVVEHPLPADTLTVKTNIDMFYSIILLKNTMVHSEKYLHTIVKDKYEFVYVMYNVEDVIKSKKDLVVVTGSQHNDLNLEYGQCQNSSCTDVTTHSVENSRIRPPCKAEQKECFILIRVTRGGKGNTTGYKPIALLVDLPVVFQPLLLNRLYEGFAQPGFQGKFVLSKEQLYKQADEICVVLEGAIGYATYDKSCQRIYCCQFQLGPGRNMIPNGKADLNILVIGSMDRIFTIMVNTDDKNYVVQHGKWISLHTEKKHIMYTYEVEKRDKDVDIHCNGDIKIYVNYNSQQFPTTNQFEDVTSKCHLTISKDKLAKSKFNIHILIDNSGTDFSFVVYDLDTPFSIPYSELFYHQLPAKEKHTYRLPISMDDTREISVMIDNVEHKNRSVDVKIGSKVFKDFDFQMIPLNKEFIKSECKDQKFCALTVELQSRSEAMEYSIMLWKREKPIQLMDGEPIKFNTGGFGAQAFFYYEVQDTNRSVNVYVTSNEAKVSVVWDVTQADQSQYHPEMWKYPLLPKDNKANTYSTHLFINSTTIGQSLQANHSKYILLTVRDDANKTLSGNMVLTAVSDTVYVSDHSILQFSLESQESMTFIYDAQQLLSGNTSKQDIYFYLNNINNKAQVYYQFVIDSDTVHKTKSSTQNFYVISMDQIKKYLGKTPKKQHSINFVVTNKESDKIGTYIVEIAPSSLDFRKLTLGYPNQFYIKKNSTLVFEYFDVKGQDFKFKIYRDKGIPSFRVRSCQGDSKTCLQEIEVLNKKTDPKELISYSRSHQLDIDHNNPQYCKKCRYYLVFYAHSEDIQGAVSVTNFFSPTYLSTSMPITTQAYSRFPDMYRFTIPAHEQRTLSFVCHTNRIKVFVGTVDTSGKRTGSLSETVVAPGTPIDIQLESMTKAITKQILVEVNEGVSALYTVILLDEKAEIKLVDGVLLNFNREADDRTTFQYICHSNTNLMVVSNTSLEVDIGCIDKVQNKKLLAETTKPEAKIQAKSDTTKSETKAEPPKAEAPKIQIAKPEPKSDAPKTDPPKPEPKFELKTETKNDTKADTAKSETKPEPIKAETSKTDLPKTQPKTDPPKTDSKTDAPKPQVKPEQPKAEVSKPEAKTEMTKTQTPKPESPKAETAKNDSQKPDSKTQQTKAATTKADQTKSEIKKTQVTKKAESPKEQKPKEQKPKPAAKDQKHKSKKNSAKKNSKATSKHEKNSKNIKQESLTIQKTQNKAEEPGVAERNSNTVIMSKTIIDSLTKTHTFILEATTCKKYKITVKNENAANFSISAVAKDIAMLPLNLTMPGRLLKGQNKIYEMTFSYKTKIKVVLRACVNGQMKVGLSHDHEDMNKSIFTQQFETNGVQHHYSSTYTVPPGVTFITVKSLSNTVQYTLEVYSMDNNQEKSSILAHVQMSNYEITYLGLQKEEDEDPVDRYQIVFPGLIIQDINTIRNITYAVVQSQNKTALQKFIKCRGSFLDQRDSHQVYTSMMDSVDTVNEFKRRINYTTDEDVYISIMPVVSPALPGYVVMEPYKIVKLTNSRGIFGWAYIFYATVHGVVKDLLDMDEGFPLTMLALITTGFLVASLIIILLFIIGCIRYAYKLRRYQMIRSYAPSEYELRHQRHLEQSLDMIQYEPTEPKKLELRYSREDGPERESTSL